MGPWRHVTDGPEEALEGYAAIKDLKKKNPPCLPFQISLKSSSVPGRLIFSLRTMIFNGSVEHAILTQVFL